MSEDNHGLKDWAKSARKMWASVVMAVMDDAITENKKNGKGTETISRWLGSRDGREVLSNAGITHDERTTKLMISYVEKGTKTTGRGGQRK